MKATVALLIASILVGCAPSATAGAGTESNKVITTEEIQSSGASTAYDVVQSLRPSWLRVRGAQRIQTRQGTSTGRNGEVAEVMASQSGIAAYRDGVRLQEGTRALRSIQASDVESIEFLSAIDATARLGGEHPQGAILVFTRS